MAAREQRQQARVYFRALRWQDIEWVAAIDDQCFPRPWSRDVFLRELGLPFSRLLLAWREDAGGEELAGYICRWLIAGEVHVLNLAVHPRHRRQGIGQALLAEILAEAVVRGGSKVFLEVRPANVAARALYRKLGFVEEGLRPHYYGRGEHALLARWAGEAKVGGNTGKISAFAPRRGRGYNAVFRKSEKGGPH